MGKRKKPVQSQGASSDGGGFGALLRAKGLSASETPSPAPEQVRESISAPSEPGFESIAKIVLRRTKKGRGGKVVTLVEGLPGDHSWHRKVAKTVGKALGCGVKAEDGLLVVQGDQRERLNTWFLEKGVRKVVG